MKESILLGDYFNSSKQFKSMGKQIIITPRSLAFILLLCSTLFASSSSAQVVQPEQAEVQEQNNSQNSSKGNSVGFMGSVSFTVIGVDLNKSITFPFGEYAGPLVGPTVQFGVNFNQQSNEPIWLIAELTRAQNVDNTTKSHLKQATVLNIGFEYPAWYIVNRKYNQFTIDYGAFASMYYLKGADSNSLNKWGIAGRLALAYRHKTQKGLTYGFKLYDLFGRYFGKNKSDNPLRFSYANEYGIGAMIYF